MTIVKHVTTKELNRKDFGAGIMKGNKSPSIFLMLNIKKKSFTKTATYVIIYMFPEGSEQKTKGGFYYDDFQYLLL